MLKIDNEVSIRVGIVAKDFHPFDGINFPQKIFSGNQTPKNIFPVDTILLEKDFCHIRQ